MGSAADDESAQSRCSALMFLEQGQMFLGVILGEGLKQGCCSCPGPWAHVSGRGTLLGAFTTQWFALFIIRGARAREIGRQIVVNTCSSRDCSRMGPKGYFSIQPDSPFLFTNFQRKRKQHAEECAYEKKKIIIQNERTVQRRRYARHSHQSTRPSL